MSSLPHFCNSEAKWALFLVVEYILNSTWSLEKLRLTFLGTEEKYRQMAGIYFKINRNKLYVEIYIREQEIVYKQ